MTGFSKSALVAVVLTTTSACMSFSDRELRPVRDSLAAQMPEITMEKEMAVSLGNGVFGFIDALTLNEADLSALDSLQVAVYSIHPRGGNVAFSDETFAASLRARSEYLSWERIVRVRDADEQVWIYAGMDLERQRLEALSVFVLEEDELVLINMEGDFNAMLEYALTPVHEHRNAVGGA